MPVNSIPVSIVIVNYNVASEIRDCLNSIDKFIGIEKLNIIVVDNNSPKREIEELPAEFPLARLSAKPYGIPGLPRSGCRARDEVEWTENHRQNPSSPEPGYWCPD